MSLGKTTVKFLVIGLVIGLVGAIIPSFILIQDREATIFSLTERNIVQEGLIEVLQNENSDLLTDKTRLETQLESPKDDLTASREETALVQQEKAKVVSEKEAVERALSDLRRVEQDLRSDLLQVQRELRQVEDELLQLQISRSEIGDKWNLWKRHSALTPQARSEYSFAGFIRSSGTYAIQQSSFLVSFPNPGACLAFADLSEGSMQPAMGPGHQLVENTCFNRADISPGDMIAFRSFGTTVHHQVIEVRADGVITKGINNELADPDVVPWANIISIVVAIIY